MGRFLDLRFLWGMGAVMLVFCAVAVMGVASVVALPLYLAVFAGMAQDTAIQIFLYSSPIWAPVGIGMGAVGAGSVARGLRRKIPEGGERVK